MFFVVLFFERRLNGGYGCSMIEYLLGIITVKLTEFLKLNILT